MSTAADHAANRAHWDKLAGAHGQDDYYDTRGLIAGQSSLVAEEEQALFAAVGDRARLDGLDIVHVQCHIGFDTVTLARRGGRVTGVDFSPVALAKARSIAERFGVEIALLHGGDSAAGAIDKAQRGLTRRPGSLLAESPDRFLGLLSIRMKSASGSRH